MKNYKKIERKLRAFLAVVQKSKGMKNRRKEWELLKKEFHKKGASQSKKCSDLFNTIEWKLYPLRKMAKTIMTALIATSPIFLMAHMMNKGRDILKEGRMVRKNTIGGRVE